ncbi:hypothetical protein ACI5OG_004198 [Salmonella enterica subsp. enterica serovar Derby]|jgi:hypothetical protein|uniref:Uncharacterized protein n=5 Tax=Enterobacteriaceae TaxID=543 RepID=A0A2X7V0V5_ECOLX|nr:MULTISPECIES: hypothetical protein [Enterobacteriaceae]YP_009914703.1 DdrA-like anti-restriction protein [Escherichia phage D6]EAA0481249.1 hypothetical protein [Shigella flexneri]EAC0626919.1 hypothetical protein [Salmonella enterica subsp. enterica serovar Corvallis]EBX0926660.1 hypothetical protein [Salmonella enterica subsp. enterica serovar Kentucky]EBY3128348.1 hypothetical protein [Salmonella enterica subsp. enterica serovar Mikawasima]ECG1458389.1 hypothetical protein [Salmonella e
MTISVLDRLKLGKELSDLMQAQKTAPVLQRVAIGKQIVDLMLKLGLGTAAQPMSEPQPQPQSDPVADEVPKIVTDFLGGVFTKSTQMEFIDALRGISNYVGEFLTLEQAKEQTISWVKANGYAG